jgi:hypothetical protein
MNDTPNDLGTEADRLLALRTKRIELSKEVDALKAQETELQNKIIEDLMGISLTSASGKSATVSLRSQTVPTVVDWSKLENFIAETGYFHLFQRRVSGPAYIELLEKDGSVPGVEPTTLTKLSLARSTK